MFNQNKLYLVNQLEIRRLQEGVSDPTVVCDLLAQALRINILYMIKNAGSGHIGTSFSSIDIMLWLWMHEMHEPNSLMPDSDNFFSSKGHDAPALYAVLTALGKIPFENIHRLRKLGGLPGHPDIQTPFVAANTGSLGMGISKARGMAIANRLNGQKGRIFVLTGDGELQEGQIWESLQPAVNGNFSEITAIADLNNIQSDTFVSRTSDLGRISDKFRTFGWEVTGCNGNNFQELKRVFDLFRTITDRPKIILAQTRKGCGVSFMESVGTESINPNGLYQYHSGAPSDEDYFRALEELIEKANKKLHEIDKRPLELEMADKPAVAVVLPQAEKLVQAYGEELVELGYRRNDFVVLDGDLMKDCGLLPFRNTFPKRFIECGIAEQDMVSVAGGLALKGILPIVNSFGCFLSSRPNEQIYNNATEKTKIIYVGNLAGLLPAGPGHSHQSVRDISSLGAIPGLTIIQPCNEMETKLAIRWAVEENPANTYVRLIIIPRTIDYKLPPEYSLKRGYGVKIKNGRRGLENLAIISYGTVMLQESFKAAEILECKYTYLSVAVFNFPWLNYADPEWLFANLRCYRFITVVDDHYTTFGLGNIIASACALSNMPHPNFLLLGLTEIPACGNNDEVLRYHKLDAKSIASAIKQKL